LQSDLQRRLLIQPNDRIKRLRLTHTNSASEQPRPFTTDTEFQHYKKEITGPDFPELKTYLDNIAAKYKPDPGALKRQIDNAEARYSRTQQFSDIPARLVVKLPEPDPRRLAVLPFS
jgi:hypothetical protein